MPANFKTYESQARLLAAVVAAHPELRLNYKAIAQHYGKSQTVSAIEHRFRPVRQQAEIIRIAVSQGVDPEELNVVEMSKDDIVKYFGESTPDGLQFHFRGVKSSAEVLKIAYDNGNDPVEAFGLKVSGGGPSPAKALAKAPRTPREPKTPSSNKKRTRKPAMEDTPTPSKSRRKVDKPMNYREETTNDDSPAIDYEELDASPTMQAKKVRMTPMKNMVLPPKGTILPHHANGGSNGTVSSSIFGSGTVAGNSSTAEATPSEASATASNSGTVAETGFHLKGEVTDLTGPENDERYEQTQYEQTQYEQPQYEQPQYEQPQYEQTAFSFQANHNVNHGNHDLVGYYSAAQFVQYGYDDEGEI
ncbi:hypothetical protein B0T17DRAFT_619504 [Bombardia bombarda]|uniref:Uncharacterized protein n=1 Tax=Bombardia bombarda TaxID=252184 RepID=A0AA40BW60_9PEZI|nr:hypothetical protein B0T17DRAFT_619504 [Bombardia bombarda]